MSAGSAAFRDRGRLGAGASLRDSDGPSTIELLCFFLGDTGRDYRTLARARPLRVARQAARGSTAMAEGPGVDMPPGW